MQIDQREKPHPIPKRAPRCFQMQSSRLLLGILHSLADKLLTTCPACSMKISGTKFADLTLLCGHLIVSTGQTWPHTGLSTRWCEQGLPKPCSLPCAIAGRDPGRRKPALRPSASITQRKPRIKTLKGVERAKAMLQSCRATKPTHVTGN